MISLPAFAKINLDLRILNTRADGYHELATVFQTIGLHDTLRIELVNGPLTLGCDARDVPADARNLVWRAVEAVWHAAGRDGSPRGLRIGLEKRVPSQAGLGGGSADAAVTLIALRRLWALPWTDERLADIGAGLGADVPFFLEGGTAAGRGRGDALTPLPDLPDRHVVIARPRFGVSTADAYRWFDELGGCPRAVPIWPADPGDWPDVLGTFANDLEPVVAARFGDVSEAVRTLRAHDAALAAMSGSGSAVFGLFAEAPVATAAAAALRSRAFETLETVTVGRSAYRAALGLG